MLESPPPGAGVDTWIVCRAAVSCGVNRVIARTLDLTKFVFIATPSKFTTESRVKPLPEIRTLSEVKLPMRQDDGETDEIDGAGLLFPNAVIIGAGAVS